MWTSRLALWGKQTTERRPPCLRPDSSQRTDVGTALWAQPGGASGGGVGAPRAPPTQRVRARATAQSAGRPRGSAWAAAGRTADGRAWHRFSERWPWLTPFLLAPALEWPGPFFTLTFSLMVFERCRGEDAEERLGVGGASALALQRVTPAPGTPAGTWSSKVSEPRARAVPKQVCSVRRGREGRSQLCVFSSCKATVVQAALAELRRLQACRGFDLHPSSGVGGYFF